MNEDILIYGKKLEALGLLIQNPSTTLTELTVAGIELGLIVRIWFQPDLAITLPEEPQMK